MNIVILRGDGDVKLQPIASSIAEIKDVARWLSDHLPYVITVEPQGGGTPIAGFHRGKEINPDGANHD